MASVPGVQGAAPPPPGVTPDFVNPVDVLHTVNLVAQVLSIVLVSVFVLLRTYAKTVLAPPFLLDDWACLVAWILAIGYSMTALMMHHYGGGYHIWEVSAEDHVGFLKSLYADTVVYGPNAYFTKVALLLVIARVFHTFTATRMVAHALMGVMAGYYVPALLIKINICRPIAAFWSPPSLARPVDGSGGGSGSNSGNSTGGGGGGGNGVATTASAAVCINQSNLFVADTVLSALTDFAVLALPIPATMSLRLPFRRRLRVWAMLGLGGVATLASIVRMVVVIRLRNVTDQTVEFVRFNLLGTAEVSIGLICACLPALNILHTRWQELRQQQQTSSSGSGGGGGGGGDGSGGSGGTPRKPMRLHNLKFLHGSRLHTAPPLSAVIVAPGSSSVATTAVDDTKRADTKRGASCPSSVPRAHVVERGSTV